MRGIVAVLVLALAACAEPSYVETAGVTPMGQPSTWTNEVLFQVHDAFRQTPPDCVAILPLNAAAELADGAEAAAKVRRALFAQLAPQARREVRLERIDHLLAELPAEPGERRRLLGQRLGCVAVLEGQVTAYGTDFLGIYSRVSAGADLKMLRASDGALLWEGRHVAVSHGGGVPLTTAGAALGVVDAVSNLHDEQLTRMTDDLARRLIHTVPDTGVLALDEPAAAPPAAPAATGAAAFLAGLEGKPPAERRAALLAAVQSGRFSGADGRKVVDALQAASADDPAAQLAAAEWLLADGDHAGALAAAGRASRLDPESHRAYFLQGRILMRDRDFTRAEPYVVQAVALDRGNARYLDALGALYGETGQADRALAAYDMAIKADVADGFAYYNTAVLYFNHGEAGQAADAFYGAGLAYLKAGDLARAGKVLGELRDLAAAGLPLTKEIDTIQNALAARTAPPRGT